MSTAPIAGYSTVWTESFDNGLGLFSRAWGPGVDTSVPGQLSMHSDANNTDSGAMVPPTGADAGEGYGFYSFDLQTNGKIGNYALVWPGTDVWPGPELDLVEIDSNGNPYSTVHWKGADGSNQYQAFMLEGVDPTQRHTYSLEWQEGRLTGYVDGAQKWTTTEHVPADAAHGGEDLAPGFGMQTFWNDSASGAGSHGTLFEASYAARDGSAPAPAPEQPAPDAPTPPSGPEQPSASNPDGDLNVLVRGQSNALLFVQNGGAAALEAKLEAATGHDVHVVASWGEGDGANTINSGSAFMDWDTDGKEAGVVAAIDKLPAEMKDNPTITVWMHNEYDQGDGGLTADAWTAEARAALEGERAALGQGAGTTPVEFVPIKYPYGGNFAPIGEGMDRLAADAAFNASTSGAAQSATMDGGPEPGAGSSHMGQADALMIGDALGDELADTARALVSGGSAPAPTPTTPDPGQPTPPAQPDADGALHGTDGADVFAFRPGDGYAHGGAFAIDGFQVGVDALDVAPHDGGGGWVYQPWATETAEGTVVQWSWGSEEKVLLAGVHAELEALLHPAGAPAPEQPAPTEPTPTEPETPAEPEPGPTTPEPEAPGQPAGQPLFEGGDGRDTLKVDHLSGFAVDAGGGRDTVVLGADHADALVFLDHGEARGDAVRGFDAEAGDLLVFRGFAEGTEVKDLDGDFFSVGGEKFQLLGHDHLAATDYVFG